MRPRLFCLCSIMAVAILAGCASSGGPTVLTPSPEFNGRMYRMTFDVSPYVPKGPVVQVSPEIAVELVAIGGYIDGEARWWNAAGEPVQGISERPALRLNTSPGVPYHMRTALVMFHRVGRGEDFHMRLSSPDLENPSQLLPFTAAGETIRCFSLFFRDGVKTTDLTVTCETRQDEVVTTFPLQGETTKSTRVLGDRIAMFQKEDEEAAMAGYLLTRPVATGVSSIVSFSGPEVLRSVAVSKQGVEVPAIEAAASVAEEPTRAVWLAEFPGLAPGDIERIELRRPVMGDAVFPGVPLHPRSALLSADRAEVTVEESGVLRSDG